MLWQKRRGGDWYGSFISWEGERKGALGFRLDIVAEVLSFCTYNHLVILVLLGSYLHFFFWAMPRSFWDLSFLTSD